MAEFAPVVGSAIKDFVFDLHDAVRRSQRDEEVNQLYEVKFKEISDKFFSSSPWPDAELVAEECNHDEGFLLFYREMAYRHITTRLKPADVGGPQNLLADQIKSWSNYIKLFDNVLTASDSELCIPPKWIYDITQEFAYQFQGFCQLRCQVAVHSAETIRILDANRDAWSFPTVLSILTKLIASAQSKQQQQRGKSTINPTSSLSVQFGYFASIELARLQCLLGDFTSSLRAISTVSLNDRSELFMQLPVCHLNVFYHTGVCNMMLRRFNEACEVFNEIVLYVSRILKPGSAASLRQGVAQQLQRMLDRVLALTGVVLTLYPTGKVDDQALEMVEAKWSEKFRKMNAGDRSAFQDLLEYASPKYISPIVPNYSIAKSIHTEASHHILDTFMGEVDQHIPFLKLRSYFGLYASIDISKLARFNDLPESDLINVVTSLKHKSKSHRATTLNPASSGSNFFMEDSVLVIDNGGSNTVQTNATANKNHEKFFINGVRKHVEIKRQLENTFEKLGL